jgi:hypothetical protein
MILPRTARRLAGFVTSVVTMAAGACAPVGPADRPVTPPGALPTLSFISEFTRPAASWYPLVREPARFGSLSGLARDAASGQWVGVIDDRLGSRVAWLAITARGSRLDVSPARIQTLRAGADVPVRIATEADLEAIVALPDGSFLMGEEGHLTEAGVWPPAILQVTREGVVTGVIVYPDEFQIAAGGKTGTRDNQGFESLTRTPNGRLIAGLEQPLADRPLTSFERGGEGRLIEFEPSGSAFRPGRQWHYDISPTPVIDGFPDVCSGGENGLVDLLAITETMLIALERACVQNPDRTAVFNPIQLFAVTLSGNTAKKTLLLDLSSLIPRLSPALARLENFEGLAFGPPVGGRRTLLMMSDDNFRATQKTSFLLFAMR